MGVEMVKWAKTKVTRQREAGAAPEPGQKHRLLVMTPVLALSEICVCVKKTINKGAAPFALQMGRLKSIYLMTNKIVVER